MTSLEKLLKTFKKHELHPGKVVDVTPSGLIVFLFTKRVTVQLPLPGYLCKLYIPEMTLTTSDGAEVTIPKTYVQMDLSELLGMHVLVTYKAGKPVLVELWGGSCGHIDTGSG